MLIFVLQTVWLYISELAGKDLDMATVGKFLLYFMPKLMPLVLPLTILLASIMVFGSFAENYEFAAMKSTGISLQRAMRSLSIFIVGLAITVFFFANNVIPWAEFNSYNLRKNIAQLKPALAIAEGQFNEIGDINIKVEKKSGDRGQYLKNVVMHIKQPKRTGNYKVIVANNGELIGSENSNLLQLVLLDGHYYEEIYSKDPKEALKRPHAKSYFEKYTINVDLEAMNQVDLEEKSFTDRFNMLNVQGLTFTIDSLKRDKTKEQKEFSNILFTRSSFNNLNVNIRPKTDTIIKGDFLQLYDAKTKSQLLNLALNTANSTNQIIDTKAQGLQNKTKLINKHLVALHEKYALGFACIILFFVGAPLGALIRKGGLGLPMVIAILLFLTYHFIGIFAKNSSQDGTLNPIFATWLSTLIMLPLGISLTRRATRDRSLFEFDSYLEPIKKFLKIKPKEIFDTDGNDISYNYFEGYTNDKLMDIIKHPEAFDYSPYCKAKAFAILSKRSVSFKTLSENGICVDENLISAAPKAKDVVEYSNFAMIFYIAATILIILHFVFKNNKMPELAAISIDLGLIALFVFLLYFVVTLVTSIKFYKHLTLKVKPVNMLLMLLGLPFYGVSHFLLKNKINEDLNSSAIDSLK
ncbi:MAG TPA: LptF/LptG family permease [Aquaticitalea sp.]|nr:LptF/LptG family permease [Aquaticitalea sp.]